MLELRSYEKADAEYIIDWVKDETAFRKWSADRYESYPITADDINRYYAQYSCADLHILTAVEENKVIGHLTIRFIDEEKKTARFGFIIIDDTKRGQGYGKQLVLSALQYAFDVLKADKVTLGVFENNAPAYFCYKAVGFRDVPFKKEEYDSINGEAWKCLELEIDQESYADTSARALNPICAEISFLIDTPPIF